MASVHVAYSLSYHTEQFTLVHENYLHCLALLPVILRYSLPGLSFNLTYTY